LGGIYIKIELVRVGEGDKAVLNGLLELYDREDDDDEGGSYRYKYLDHYFKEPGWIPYYITADGERAGFALITPVPEVRDIPTDRSISEFYVFPQYRNRGVGRAAVFALLDKYRGRWQLSRDPRERSVSFWDRVIGEYTGGGFTLRKAHPYNLEYDPGVFADAFFFDS
jgi:predicted acetyltransferase